MGPVKKPRPFPGRVRWTDWKEVVGRFEPVCLDTRVAARRWGAVE